MSRFVSLFPFLLIAACAAAVPEAFTVRYRVWSADNVMQDAPAE